MGSYQILFFLQRGWKKRKTFGEFLEKENALYLFICRAEGFSCVSPIEMEMRLFHSFCFLFYQESFFSRKKKIFGGAIPDASALLGWSTKLRGSKADETLRLNALKA